MKLQLFRLCWVLLKMLVNLCVLLLLLVLCASDYTEFFAKFEGDYVTFSNSVHERYENWKTLMRDAHAKFKFKPGIIYYNVWDTAGVAYATSNTYYQTTYRNEYDLFKNFIGPDWTSVSWPKVIAKDFSTTVYFILEASASTPKNNKVGWVGDTRSPLPERVEYKTRPMLLEFTANYSHLFDFRHHTPGPWGHVDMVQLVSDYAYLLDIGGNGYSGRLKYLLWSGRPLLYVERDHIEYFNAYLKPNVHYIPVKQDLSDLVSQTEWVVNNPEKASEIAQNAVEFASEFLTHDAFVDRAGEVVQWLLDHPNPNKMLIEPGA